MVKGHFLACRTPKHCWCEVRRYWLVLGISVIILTLEIVGGIVSGSLALIADAGHVTTDMATAIISIIVASRVKNNANKRIRIVGGYMSAALLGMIAVWIGFEAWERFENPTNITGPIMTFVALIGTVGNYLQHRIIANTGETHVTHKAMHLHIWSDLLQSIGVVVGGALIWATGVKWIDPALSFAIAALMLRWTVILLKDLVTGKYNNDSTDHSHPN